MIEDLFINILEISITSAAAIGIILFISGLAESRFRKKWRYWVWLLLAIYLIIPFKFDFPDAPIRVEIPPHEMIITEKTENISKPEDYEIISGGLSTGMQNEHAVGTEIIGTGEQNSSLSTDVSPKDEISEEPLSTTPRIFIFPLVFLGAVIWASGAVIVCGWNIAMYLRFVTRSTPWNREIKNEEVLSLFEWIKEDMGVSKRVRIFENRLIKSPMMVGFIKPKVLLPAEELLPEEYEFVIRHELTHFKRGDIWYKFLLMLAASVHWFNPMVGTMCRYAENDIEITCDAAVMKAMEGDRRQEYCATILNIMRRGQNSPLLLSTSFYGGAKILKKRFAAILEPRAHRGIVLFIIAMLVIAISGTLVACTTAEIPSVKEEQQQEQQEDTVPVEEEVRILAEDLIDSIYLTKKGIDAKIPENLSKEAKKSVDEVLSGAKDGIFEYDSSRHGLGKIQENLIECVRSENTVSIVFEVVEEYEIEGTIEKDVYFNTFKVSYDIEKEEFTEVRLRGFNWFEDGADKPAVTGPDEDGVFPAIKAADWDRWVNYEGEADKVMPEAEIPSAMENEKLLRHLKSDYPNIDDWELIYEKKGYTLKSSYDPYTYSHRGIYLPEWFILLKTEQSETFDRLIIRWTEDYAVFLKEEKGEQVYVCQITNGYNAVEAFESEIKVGDMREGVIFALHDFQSEITGDMIWFPGKNRMVFFTGSARLGGANRAFAIEGINEPLYIRRVYMAFAGRDLNGNMPEVPAGRENDMFFEVDVSPKKNSEKGTVAYYDAETKTVDLYENCVVDGLFEYPQIYYLDSETVMIEAGSSLSFYKGASHNLITEAFAEIGHKELGLTEEIEDILLFGTDKTKGGRYAIIYTDTEKGEYSACTFDKKGNVLSNFGLGLSSEGSISITEYKSGIIYFGYSESEEDSEKVNYAVDARPDKKHILQEIS